MPFAERWERRRRIQRAKRAAALAVLLGGAVYGGRIVVERYGRQIAAEIRWAMTPPPLPPRVRSETLPIGPSESPELQQRKPSHAKSSVAMVQSLPLEEEPPKKTKTPKAQRLKLVYAKNWIFYAQDFDRPRKGGLRDFDDLPFGPREKPRTLPSNPSASGRTASPYLQSPIGEEDEDEPSGEPAMSRTAPMMGGGPSETQVREFQKTHVDLEAQRRLQQEYLAAAERERWIRALITNIGIGMGLGAAGFVAIFVISGLWRAYRRF